MSGIFQYVFVRDKSFKDTDVVDFVYKFIFYVVEFDEYDFKENYRF